MITQFIQSESFTLPTNKDTMKLLFGQPRKVRVMNESKERSLVSDSLASYAHDMNNLLFELSGMLAILAKANSTSAGGFTIHQASSCALSIVNLSQSIMYHYVDDVRGTETRLSPFSIRKVLKDLHTIFQPTAKKRGINLELSIQDSRLNSVISDKGKVSLILFNLLHNAFKYTEEGTISMHASYDETSGFCSLVVEDSGVGVPPDKSATIFRILEQGHEDSENRGGLGLGLSLCKKLTEVMGGKISLIRLAQGSRFHAKFPVEFSQIERPPDKLASRRPLTILIVDDSKLQRKTFRNLAEPFGCTIVEADNGQSAIDLLTKDVSPDFILMDGHMPGMNGPDTVSLIRKNESHLIRNIPIYALSGMDTDSQVVEFTGTDITGYLEKPLREEEFQNLLDRHASLAR